nr:hypothetical protein [Deltaproteobacteria bacterium]
MAIFRDPFFWALVSMFGLVGSGAAVGSKKVGRYPLFGFFIVVVFDLGRVVLVLPFCPQMRFEMSGWHGVVGGIIFTSGLIFCLPAFTIKPFTAPDV